MRSIEQQWTEYRAVGGTESLAEFTARLAMPEAKTGEADKAWIIPERFRPPHAPPRGWR